MAGDRSMRERHPSRRFVEADTHNFDLGEAFDYVVCSDVGNDVWDVQEVFGNIARHCHPGARLEDDGCNSHIKPARLVLQISRSRSRTSTTPLKEDGASREWRVSPLFKPNAATQHRYPSVIRT